MNCNPEVYMLIGQVIEARNNFMHLKSVFSNVEQEYNGARSVYYAYGHYDDCGPSYQSDYEEAKGRLEQARLILPSAEARYLSLKSDFFKKFPDEKTLLNKAIKTSKHLLKGNSSENIENLLNICNKLQDNLNIVENKYAEKLEDAVKQPIGSKASTNIVKRLIKEAFLEMSVKEIESLNHYLKNNSMILISKKTLPFEIQNIKKFFDDLKNSLISNSRKSFY